MSALDLLASANDLVQAGRGRPRQSNLGKAISCAYYAMFHCLAESNANLLVGGRSANRSDRAWNQAYRALQHGLTAGRCRNQQYMRRFPKSIRDFAEMFVVMQNDRHAVDYDPSDRRYKSEVMQAIAVAQEHIDLFRSASASDRKAFAVFVLLPLRKR